MPLSASARGKPPKSDPIAFAGELLDDDTSGDLPRVSPAELAEAAAGAASGRRLPEPPPSTDEPDRWLSDPSGSGGAHAAPVVQPIPRTEGAPVVAPIVAPVVRPVAQPVLPRSAPDDSSLFFGSAAPGSDVRVVDIATAFEFPSYACDDEPLANVLVTLTPDGLPLLDPAAGPVAHVVLALDVSASMNRTDKYPLLTEALAGMLYDLKRPGTPDVLLSVVVYAYGAEVVFRDRPASALDPREVLREIDRSRLRFGRYTDVVGALKHAGRIAVDQVRANRAMPVRICLLTDGRPQDMDGARRVLEKIRTAPVDVDAFAFGGDADVAALQELVSGGRGGTVKQIRSDTISEAFGHIAETAGRVVSNRAVFEFELRPGLVGGAAFRYRPARHRFGDAAFEGGRVFTTDLGTLEAGRRYTLFFQVRLPTSTSLETEVGRITLRLPGHGGPRLFESLVSISRDPRRHTFMADREVQAAWDVLGALGASDPREQLRALRTRRKLYGAERRDPHVLAALDRAIEELEDHGNLERLSLTEQATILSHTCTAGGAR